MSIEAYQLESVIRIPLGWLEKKHAEWVERDTRKTWLAVRSVAIGHAVLNRPGAPSDVQIKEAQQYEDYIRNGGPPRDAGT